MATVGNDRMIVGRTAATTTAGCSWSATRPVSGSPSWACGSTTASWCAGPRCRPERVRLRESGHLHRLLSEGVPAQAHRGPGRVLRLEAGLDTVSAWIRLQRNGANGFDDEAATPVWVPAARSPELRAAAPTTGSGGYGALLIRKGAATRSCRCHRRPARSADLARITLTPSGFMRWGSSACTSTDLCSHRPSGTAETARRHR